MRTDKIGSTARLLLKLYGQDVVFDGPGGIDRFLSDAELIDKPFWRSVLLAARELQPVGAHSIH